MSEDTRLLERIDNVQAFLQSGGKYHTSSAHQAFGVLKALDWHPWVKLGEELYFPEGSVLFAEVDPIKSLTPNVEKVGWGTTDDYYERRLRDYDNWEVAFWREVVQNSRDSGATRVDLECVEDVYEDPETKERVEAVRVSVSDNGRGMDYDTLMTAFFRRGGTLKQEGSVGGFGDAKNLILTPWLGYEVRSHDVVVRGRHEDLFADLTKQGLPYHEGTKVTVWMPTTKTTTSQYAQFLIEQSSLDNIRFTVDGGLVKGSLPRGKLIQDSDIVIEGQSVGKLLIYHSPRARRKGVYVRSHGLYMYEAHGFSGDFKGVVTIEVNAPPINVFTTKRDSLSYQSSARADVNDVMQRLASDPRTTLKALRDKKQAVFRGTGAIEAMEGRVAEMAAEIAQRAQLEEQKRQKNGTIKLDKNALRALVDAFTGKADELDQETDDGSAVSLSPLPSTFGTLMAQTDFVNVEQIAGAIQISMWKPDFFLYQNISPWKLPKALHPETMQNKYHVLLAVWTEVCKFLLVQFGMFEPFGVGWVFDTDYDPAAGGEMVIGAAYSSYEGKHWLLINPVEIERHGWDDNVSFSLSGDRFQLNIAADVEVLVSLAVHEITHMQGFSSHTEAYVGAITDNMKAVFRIAPVLKKIVKEARASVREVRKATKETAVTKSKPDYAWHKIDAQIYAMRNSDRLYVGYIEKMEGSSWYDVYIAMAPSDPTDVKYDGLWVRSESSENKAKKVVTDLAAKKFPTEPVLGVRIDWETDPIGDNVYGFDPVSQATRAAVLITQPFSDGDKEYVPRAWHDGAEEWIMGTARSSLQEAKEVAERMYAEMDQPSKGSERFVWDPDEGNEFTYGVRKSDEATSVGVKRFTRRIGDPSATYKEEELFVPRVWVDKWSEWSEGGALHTFDEAKAKAEAMHADYAAGSL